MFISISQWKKLYPRNDYKSLPWLRLDSNIGHAKGLFGLGPDQKWVWIALLALAAQSNDDGRLDVDLPYLAAYAGVDEARTHAALLHFERKKLIKIADERPAAEESHDFDVREPIAGRTDDVREPNGGFDDSESDVRYVTNVTNETDVTNGQGYEGHPADPPSPPRRLHKTKAAPGPATASGQVWESYRAAYAAKYGHDPVRNAKVNSQCANLVSRVGAEVAPKLVAFYLTHNGRFYVQTLHALGPCLQDAEALHTQMVSGQRVTASIAQAQDKRQGTVQAFANVAAKLAAERSDDGNG